jgi:hypothetical protein
MSFLDVAVTGFSTGLGVITAQWFNEKYIKDRLNRRHEQIARVLSNGRGGTDE